MEEEKTVVEQEPVQAIADAAESPGAEERVEQPQESSKKRNDAEYNWAEANRLMKEQQKQIRERDDYIAKMKQQADPPKEEEIGLGDDDLPTYGHVKKAMSKDKKKLVEEIRKEVRAELAQTTLKFRYPDFDDVVTSDNIETLKKRNPELAMSLGTNPDPYAQAVAIYDALKMTGISESPKPSPDKERAIKNSQKPLSVNAIPKQSAIGNIGAFENGLTPELKKQLYEEMKNAAKYA